MGIILFVIYFLSIHPSIIYPWIWKLYRRAKLESEEPSFFLTTFFFLAFMFRCLSIEPKYKNNTNYLINYSVFLHSFCNIHPFFVIIFHSCKDERKSGGLQLLQCFTGYTVYLRTIDILKGVFAKNERSIGLRRKISAFDRY